MAGPRYTDWSHVHVVGDRSAAEQLLPEARKLLGFVVEDAGRNGLQTHLVTRRFANGASIVAEIRGGIPRITIVVPPTSGARPPVRPPDDFVVWARDAISPGGLDPEYPQQILRPEGEGWRVFTYNLDIGEGLTEDTYGGLFPEGLRYAGNIDWRGSNGERVNWYGPSSRYWIDDCRTLEVQFGRHVFMLGRILLDVDDYCTDSDIDLDERTVLGAALRGLSLYVVMAEAPTTPIPAPPASPSPTLYAWATPGYPDVTVPVVLRRFSLAIDPTVQDPMKFKVLPGSHEDLWSDDVPRGLAPWHFDQAAETVVAHLPPASSQCYWRGPDDLVRPSASHTRIELARNGSGNFTASTTAVSLLPGAGQAVIAEDGGVVLSIARADDWSGLRSTAHYKLGEHSYLAFDHSYDPRFFQQRRILWADLREGALLLLEFDRTNYFEHHYTRFRVLLCHGGVETVLLELDDEGGSIAEYGTIFGLLGEQAVAPLGLVHLHAFGFGMIPEAATDFALSLLPVRALLPFQRADTYGTVRITNTPSMWAVTDTLSDRASTSPASQQVDNLEHTSMPGVAFAQGKLLASYDLNLTYDGEPILINHITGGVLGELTGVNGEDARYHPVWLLGQLPLALR